MFFRRAKQLEEMILEEIARRRARVRELETKIAEQAKAINELSEEISKLKEGMISQKTTEEKPFSFSQMYDEMMNGVSNEGN